MRRNARLRLFCGEYDLVFYFRLEILVCDGEKGGHGFRRRLHKWIKVAQHPGLSSLVPEDFPQVQLR